MLGLAWALLFGVFVGCLMITNCCVVTVGFLFGVVCKRVAFVILLVECPFVYLCFCCLTLGFCGVGFFGL